MKIPGKLFIAVLLISSISSVFAQEAAKSKDQENINNSLPQGNLGYMYQNPDILEETLKTKTVTPAGRDTPRRRILKKYNLKKPQSAYLKTPNVILKKKPVSPAETTTTAATTTTTTTAAITTLTPEAFITTNKLAASPEDSAASLKAKLEAALEQLATANKKIGELQKNAPPPKITDTYQVKKGDCLWTIAKKKEVYDNPYKWLVLYHANRDQIYDPSLIFPHMILIIPRLDEYKKADNADE